MEKVKKSFRTVLTVLTAVLLALAFMMPSEVLAEDSQSEQTNRSSRLEPAKTLTDLEDGTYELSLSVKGTQFKEQGLADIIVVLDTSGSMSTNYTSDGRTRMQAAQDALNGISDTLFSKNIDSLSADQQPVNVRFITFDTLVYTDSTVYTDAAGFTAAVNGLDSAIENRPEGYRATNWEGALQAAEAVPVRSNAAKFVIFLSDGNPTVRMSPGDYGTKTAEDQSVISTDAGAAEDQSEVSAEAGAAEDQSEVSAETDTAEDQSEVSAEAGAAEDQSEVSAETDTVEDQSEVSAETDTAEDQSEVSAEENAENNSYQIPTQAIPAEDSWTPEEESQHAINGDATAAWWGDNYAKFGVYGQGVEWETSLKRCYEQSLDEASALVGNGYVFYAMSIFGNPDKMENLVSTAYGGAVPDGRYCTSSDTASMEDNLTKILASIGTTYYYYDNVVLSDTMTPDTANAITDPGLENGFTYSVIDNEGNLQSVMINQDGTLSFAVNGETKTVSAAEANENDDGTVTVIWDLSSLGQLPDDWTFTVSWKVWPSQAAYDNVADKMNGNDVSLSNYYYENNGQYYYRTNTDGGATVSYDQVTETDGNARRSSGKDIIENPAEGMLVVPASLTMKKVWGEGTEPSDSVTFELYRKPAYYSETEPEKVGTFVLNESNGWQISTYVSVGLAISEDQDSDRQILNSGYVYYLKETEGGTDCVFTTEYVHPSLYNSSSDIFFYKADSDGNDVMENDSRILLESLTGYNSSEDDEVPEDPGTPEEPDQTEEEPSVPETEEKDTPETVENDPAEPAAEEKEQPSAVVNSSAESVNRSLPAASNVETSSAAALQAVNTGAASDMKYIGMVFIASAAAFMLERKRKH